mmetsp:Transcript_8507/g.38698  ORF Transcript_8507/g.38698 Transcript_8507/m.38698 type:complete len:215 (+) Transcript_8507:1130-1774(+)
MVFCASLRTFLLYWLSSSVNSCAASGLAGEAGFGSVSRDWIDVSRVHTLCMGDHWSWMMSMQSVPSEYTFGWNTSEVNRTLGGFSGYCSPNVIRSENTPPSQAVSSGPKIVALQTNRLSSLWGLALHPSGGSVLMALRSDCSLSTAAVCWHDAPAIAPSPNLRTRARGFVEVDFCSTMGGSARVSRRSGVERGRSSASGCDECAGERSAGRALT